MGATDWVLAAGWNCTSTHPSNGIGTPLAPIKFSPASYPSNSSMALNFNIGNFFSKPAFLYTCVSEGLHWYSIKHTRHCTLHSYEPGYCCMLLRFQITCKYITVPTFHLWPFCVSRCSVAWQRLLWILQWSFLYFCPQYRTALPPENGPNNWSGCSVLWK